jgi:hypothetical protein
MPGFTIVAGFTIVVGKRPTYCRTAKRHRL